MQQKILGRICLLLVLLLSSGCEKFKNNPVDVNSTPLVGYWLGEQVTEVEGAQIYDRALIHVRNDGYLRYTVLSCGNRDGQLSEKKLALDYMPVTLLTSVKLILQTYPLTTKYELTLGTWPDQGSGVWEVDTIPLHRIEADALPDFEAWHCE